MKIGVVGCGNVGFNTLMSFHKNGHDVKGYDLSKEIQEKIKRDIGVESVARDLRDLIACELVFICVPTDPVEESGEADLSIMEAVVGELSQLEGCREYNCAFVVQRSTCPPGTARLMSAKFLRTEYIVNPSFLHKHTQWKDTIEPERVAIAGSEDGVKKLKEVYDNFPGVRYVTSNYEEIELLKYVENSLDAVLISFWNEILRISDEIGIPRENFVNIIDKISERDKFSTTQRIPTGAFGMWCLPKDLSALLYSYGRNIDLNVLEAAKKTNEQIREKWGENETHGKLLWEFKGGRIRVSEAGRRKIEKQLHKGIDD